MRGVRVVRVVQCRVVPCCPVCVGCVAHVFVRVICSVVRGPRNVGSQVLYRYVHSLHHKSYNPTAFSGISMHPVESFLYYNAALIPVLFHAHPLVFLLTQVSHVWCVGYCEASVLNQARRHPRNGVHRK